MTYRHSSAAGLVASLAFAALVAGRPAVAHAQQSGTQRPPAAAHAQQSQNPPDPQTQGKTEPGPIRRDEEVVVTAERDTENIRNVGSSVSIITREQIRDSGALWLVDVLQFAPGVSVARSGPAGSLTQVFTRGANTGHTLLLIDGVRANSPTTGGYDLGGLPLAADQIERIEVVRGPQGTLYGSQAIGGVINVITRSGSGPGTWGAEADGGSYGTGRFHTWGNGEYRSLRYTGSVSYFDSQGFSAANRNDGNREADGYRNLSYNGRVDYASQRGLVVRGYARGFDSDLDFDGFDFAAGPIDNLVNVQSNRESYFGAAAGYEGGRASSVVEVSSTEVDLGSETPGDFFLGFDLDSSIREVDWQNQVTLGGSQRLVAGVEYRRERAESLSRSVVGASGFNEKVDVVGVYAQDRIRAGSRANLTGGVRFESHSTFGDKWTGRVTATVDATDVVRIHGSAGSGFKAPTLNDLYFPGFSNPELEPEESLGYDLGVEVFVPLRAARVDVTVFHNDISQLIEFDFVTGAPDNLGDVVTSGVEVSGDWSPAAAVTISGDYTFTDATADGSDEQLIRRPRHQGGVRATVQAFPSLRIWSELLLKGERGDAGPAGRETLAGFAAVNLTADYRVTGALQIRGRIDNLFDAAYEEVFGYGTAGLSGYLGATVTVSRR